MLVLILSKTVWTRDDEAHLPNVVLSTVNVDIERHRTVPAEHELLGPSRVTVRLGPS